MALSVMCELRSFATAITKFCGVQNCGSTITQTIRWASKKAGTTSRNKRKNTPGKKRGWKKFEGDYVEAGMILYRQLGLKVYPGENVGCGRDLTLFALRPGRVMITHETLSPYPQSPLRPAFDSGIVFKKYFFHVVAVDSQPKLFRLVSQI